MNKRVLCFMVMIALFQFLKAESRPEAIEKIEVYYYSMTIYSGNSHPLYMNGISFCEFDLECSFHSIQEFAQSFYKHAYYIPDVCLGYEKMMIRGYVPFPSSYSKALCLQDSLSSHSIKKTINIEKEKVVVEYCQFTGIFWVGDQKVFGCLSADVAEVYHIRLKDKCYILKDILNFYDNTREGSGGVPVDTLKTTGYKRTALRTAKEQNRVTHVRAEQCRQVYQPHPINAVRVAKLGANSSYVGNFENEGHAGNGLLPQGLDYSQLRRAQEGVIAACYDSLGYSYIPMNHRDAKDIVMIPTGGKDTQRRGANPNIEWQRVYYYCTDHIGSTRLVLDDSARIAERLMFLPTGEVFMDEQNSTLYHSDFLFSGKELDAETGNYYYGARYYAPRIGIWLSPDPLQLKYPHVSSYAYCAGNPLTFIDLWGKEKLNAFNLKGKSEKLGTELYITPLSDDPNSIILFAHGSMNGFRAFGKGLPDVGQVINTVEGFEEYLTSHSHIWNERYVKDNKISVVLFVCESGKDQPGHDSFAKQFSKAHPEISVFAPNDEAIIYKDGSARVKNNNNWLEYSNGTIVGKYHSGAEPGTVKFKNTTIWNKMNNNNDKYTVPWQQDQ